jgi:1,2-dihydroxy-3-keto-5-methylthiopentene dioxygenase
MKLHWLEPENADEPIAIDELARAGVSYEHRAVDPAAYQPMLDALRQERGYAEQDIVELEPNTPELEAICEKFAEEHLHTDDEVRYVLQGEGIFDIRSADDRWMRVVVEEGDLLVVPAHRYHRFSLTERKHIRCVRLFKDSSGWVPHYRGPQSKREGR